MGYLPSRVDIGIKGAMPYDAKLLRQQETPIVLKGRTLSIIEAQQKRGKSELGLVKTSYTGMRSASVHGDYQNATTYQNTNHPGTLLKNTNPKIAPKNQGSEFARKKVQNLLNKTVFAPHDATDQPSLALQTCISSQKDYSPERTVQSSSEFNVTSVSKNNAAPFMTGPK